MRKFAAFSPAADTLAADFAPLPRVLAVLKEAMGTALGPVGCDGDEA